RRIQKKQREGPPLQKGLHGAGFEAGRFIEERLQFLDRPILSIDEVSHCSAERPSKLAARMRSPRPFYTCVNITSAPLTSYLPAASTTLMSFGLIGHPAAASYSVDSESLPSGRVSPTLMVISVSAVSSFRERLASRSWAAKSKCLPDPRRLAIFPAMQTAAEAIQ